MLSKIGPLQFLGQKARSLFGRARSIDAACLEKQVLCPAETVEVDQACHVSGQLDRIISTPAETDIEAETRKISARSVDHAETASFRFRNARLYRGSVFAGGYRHYLKAPSSSAGGKPVEFEDAALISSLVGIKYFGHWLTDDMATHDLAADGQPKVCLPPGAWDDVPTYCRLLDRDCQTVDDAFFANLTLFRDFSQNSLKEARYRTMRAMLSARVEPDGDADIVYLAREGTGVARTIDNEIELAGALQKHGARVLSLERDSVTTILAALRRARLIITVEGSQQMHGLYALPDTAALLVMQPPRRFNMIRKGFADCLGWPFGFHVGEDRGDAFHVDPDEVLRLGDELNKRL